MSTRIRLIVLGLPLALGCTVNAQSNTVNRSSTRPANVARATATQPAQQAAATATQPATDGTVTQALMKLYRIPRPQAGATRESASNPPTGNNARRPAPAGQTVQKANGGDVVVQGEPQPTYTVSPEVVYPGTYAPGDYYRFGFWDRKYDRSNFRAQGEERRQAVLSHAGAQMSRGLEAFRSGQYRTAVKYFKLTAEMNQGDPACRIYATHALFAIGRYSEAAEYLRRAFSLEPRIAMLTYDIRDDYANKADFEAQLAELHRAAQAAPTDLARLALLGYVLNYSDQPDNAYQVLARARKIDPRDALVQTLFESTNPPDAATEKQPGRSN
jgi:hypothetical protein